MTAPRGAPAPAIFFLSDYGTADEFVGVVHAVLHRLATGVVVIDLTHQVRPFDVASAARVLVRCAPSLGPGVLLAVVDPGVGTDRRGVAVAVEGLGSTPGPGWLVGPDNGLLVPAADALGGAIRVVELAASTSTFDGRDVFAPAAAHLVGGGDPSLLGPDIDPRGLVEADETIVDVGLVDDPGGPPSVLAPVTWVDRFGNVQLRLSPVALAALGTGPGGIVRISVGAQRPSSADLAEAARWVTAFAQLDVGELGVLPDANGAVALVLDRASAAHRLGIGEPGTPVRIWSEPAV